MGANIKRQPRTESSPSPCSEVSAAPPGPPGTASASSDVWLSGQFASPCLVNADCSITFPFFVPAQGMARRPAMTPTGLVFRTHSPSCAHLALPKVRLTPNQGLHHTLTCSRSVTASDAEAGTVEERNSEPSAPLAPQKSLRSLPLDSDLPAVLLQV